MLTRTNVRRSPEPPTYLHDASTVMLIIERGEGGVGVQPWIWTSSSITDELVETTYVVSPSFGSSLTHCQGAPLLHGLAPLVDHWSTAPFELGDRIWVPSTLEEMSR